jgi:hypothetical protein
MNSLVLYFTFGVGLYIGLTLNNPMSFLKASAAAIIRGLLLGIVFWPIGIIIKIVMIMTNE